MFSEPLFTFPYQAAKSLFQTKWSGIQTAGFHSFLHLLSSIKKKIKNNSNAQKRSFYL